MEGFVGDTHDAPLGKHVRAELLVKGDGRRVPGEDVPLQPWAAFIDRDLGEVPQEGSADSLPSTGWRDVDVLQA